MMDKKPVAAAPAKEADESALARWSRRRLESRRSAPPPVAPDEESQVETRPGKSRKEEAPPLADADMPPLASLSGNSDAAAFMSPGVSDSLRRRALRRIFSSQKFNLRDGLDDYDEDFSSFIPLGDVVTAEMRRQWERMKNANAQEEQTEDPTDSPADPATADSSPSGDAANEDEESAVSRAKRTDAGESHG